MVKRNYKMTICLTGDLSNEDIDDILGTFMTVEKVSIKHRKERFKKFYGCDLDVKFKKLKEGKR